MQYGTTNVSKCFGTHNDHQRWYDVLSKGLYAAPFPETYTRTSLSWNDALYGIESNVECIPHLAQWGMDNVTHNRGVSKWVVKKTLAAYLANMNDDELAMLDPVLKYIEVFGEVLRIQCFSASVELCIYLNGVQRTLLINVMNMMDMLENNNELAPYYIRSTLN